MFEFFIQAKFFGTTKVAERLYFIGIFIANRNDGNKYFYVLTFKNLNLLCNLKAQIKIIDFQLGREQ